MPAENFNNKVLAQICWHVFFAANMSIISGVGGGALAYMRAA